jgi:hypothetical protein
MAECSLCSEPAVAYLQVYRVREKVGSYPVCTSHAIWGYGFQQLGQDWARSELAKAFGIRKGSLPRIKVSLTQ